MGTPAKTTAMTAAPKTAAPKDGEIVKDDKASSSNLPAAASTTALSADFADEFQSMATGLEKVTTKDMIVPRLTILQALSPQLNERKPEYIEGAKVGQFCDVALNEVFGESFLFLPCYFAVVYLEWAPRSSGKGLIANHGTDATCLRVTTKDDKGKNVTKDGNYIAETATYFGLNLTAGGRRSFIPLSATQLKASRALMTKIMNQRVLNPNSGKEFMPPIFYRAWKTLITHESNAQGDWFGWKFEPDQTIFELDPSKALLAEAKDFHEQAAKGLVQGDIASYADDVNNAERNGDGAKVVGSESAEM